MDRLEDNRFNDFFIDPTYLKFKQFFWNYRVRLQSVQKTLRDASGSRILEVGSGVAPMVAANTGVVYVDPSRAAIFYLSYKFPQCQSEVAFAENLPFGNEYFDLVVSSEVLEHIQDDKSALMEMLRVLKRNGKLILTVPSHHYFWGLDDDFVDHKRRYEPKALEGLLNQCGFTHVQFQPVCGVLDKFALISATAVFRFFSFPTESYLEKKRRKRYRFLGLVFPIYWLLNSFYGFLVWVEATIIPISWATCVRVVACKNKGSVNAKS